MDFFRTIPIPADESSFELSTVLYSYEGSDPPEFKWMNPKGGGMCKLITEWLQQAADHLSWES